MSNPEENENQDQIEELAAQDETAEPNPPPAPDLEAHTPQNTYVNKSYKGIDMPPPELGA